VLQHRVLDQMRRPKFRRGRLDGFVADIALDDLLKLLPRIDGFVLKRQRGASTHEGGQRLRPR